MMVHYMDVHDWAIRLLAESGSESLIPDKARGMQAYKDQVRSADRHLSELLDAWSSARGYEQSMIAFLSDHGEHLFSPGSNLYHGHTMADALLHVPLVLKFPERAGITPHRSRRAVSLVDLAPTLMDLVGAEWSADDFDGISLLDPAAAETTRTLFADYQLFGSELSSVRRGPMKLVMNLSRGTEVLIDLRKPYTSEVGERGQVAEDPEVQKLLRDAFQSYVRESHERTVGLKSRHEVDPDEVVEQLRALGYLK